MESQVSSRKPTIQKYSYKISIKNHTKPIDSVFSQKFPSYNKTLIKPKTFDTMKKVIKTKQEEAKLPMLDTRQAQFSTEVRSKTPNDFRRRNKLDSLKGAGELFKKSELQIIVSLKKELKIKNEENKLLKEAKEKMEKNKKLTNYQELIVENSVLNAQIEKMKTLISDFKQDKVDAIVKELQKRNSYNKPSDNKQEEQLKKIISELKAKNETLQKALVELNRELKEKNEIIDNLKKNVNIDEVKKAKGVKKENVVKREIINEILSDENKNKGVDPKLIKTSREIFEEFKGLEKPSAQQLEHSIQCDLEEEDNFNAQPLIKQKQTEDFEAQCDFPFHPDCGEEEIQCDIKPEKRDSEIQCELLVNSSVTSEIHFNLDKKIQEIQSEFHNEKVDWGNQCSIIVETKDYGMQCEDLVEEEKTHASKKGSKKEMCVVKQPLFPVRTIQIEVVGALGEKKKAENKISTIEMTFIGQPPDTKAVLSESKQSNVTKRNLKQLRQIFIEDTNCIRNLEKQKIEKTLKRMRDRRLKTQTPIRKDEIKEAIRESLVAVRQETSEINFEIISHGPIRKESQKETNLEIESASLFILTQHNTNHLDQSAQIDIHSSQDNTKESPEKIPLPVLISQDNLNSITYLLIKTMQAHSQTPQKFYSEKLANISSISELSSVFLKSLDLPSEEEVTMNLYGFGLGYKNKQFDIEHLRKVLQLIFSSEDSQNNFKINSLDILKEIKEPILPDVISSCLSADVESRGVIRFEDFNKIILRYHREEKITTLGYDSLIYYMKKETRVSIYKLKIFELNYRSIAQLIPMFYLYENDRFKKSKTLNVEGTNQKKFDKLMSEGEKKESKESKEDEENKKLTKAFVDEVFKDVMDKIKEVKAKENKEENDKENNKENKIEKLKVESSEKENNCVISENSSARKNDSNSEFDI